MSALVVAEGLVDRFRHMVERDGGELVVLAAEAEGVTLGYRSGVDPDCDDGVCVLPHAELEQLIQETVRRSDPDLTVTVEVVE